MKLILHFLIVPFLFIIALGLIIWNHFPQFIPWRKIPLCDRCNIVVIDIDVLRADALSCMGNKRNTTPNICGFAKNSVLFEKNIAQSYWTLPSIFSTITSQYPSAHGVYRRGKVLPQTIPTMAEIFQNAAYRTMWVGETGWTVTSSENGGLRGFDEVVQPTSAFSNWDKIARQFLTNGQPAFVYFYDGSSLHLPYTLDQGESPIEDLDKPRDFPEKEDEFRSLFADYLKAQAGTIFTDLARSEHPELFQDVVTTDKYKLYDFFHSVTINQNEESLHNYVRDDLWVELINYYMRHIYSEDIEDQRRRVAYARMLYDTKLFEIDKKLVPLLKLLNSSEFSRNTVVVFLSDHGEEFMEHGNLSHGQIYNEVLHTPLVIRIPGVLPTKLSNITKNIDVLPTLLEASGISYEGHLQGNSLFSLMESHAENVLNYAVSFADLQKISIQDDTWSFADLQKISIQDDTWKLISDFSVNPKPIELYNLLIDPAEQRNVIDSEKQKADELLKILVDLVAKSTNRN